MRVHNRLHERKAKQRAFERHLLPFFGSTRLSLLTTEQVDEFKRRKIDSGLKAKTVNNLLAMLGRCLTAARDWDIPCASIRMRFLRTPPPPFRVLSTEEMEAVLAVSEHCEPWGLLLLTAMETGLRIGEVRVLQWEDVLLDRGLIHVRQSLVDGVIDAPKNNRTRYVVITQRLRVALQHVRRKEGFLFLLNGRHFSNHAAYNALKRICKAAEVRPFGYHVCRHTYATRLATLDASPQAIQSLMGHATLQMTLRYAHVNERHLRVTTALLDQDHKNRMGNGGANPPIEGQKSLQNPV